MHRRRWDVEFKLPGVGWELTTDEVSERFWFGDGGGERRGCSGIGACGRQVELVVVRVRVKVSLVSSLEVHTVDEASGPREFRGDA